MLTSLKYGLVHHDLLRVLTADNLILVNTIVNPDRDRNMWASWLSKFLGTFNAVSISGKTSLKYRKEKKKCSLISNGYEQVLNRAVKDGQ